MVNFFFLNFKDIVFCLSVDTTMATEKEYVVQKPEFFISGGQTGADSIPIECYKLFNVKLKGYMPHGYKRDSGDGKEIAEKHGLLEGEGSYPWKDMKNVDMCDALIAFLLTPDRTGGKPSGRGTMQTINYCMGKEYRKKDENGEWKHSEITAPPYMTCPHYIYNALCWKSEKPVLIIWNLDETNAAFFAEVVCRFLFMFEPKNLMFTGPSEAVAPNILRDGVTMMKRVLPVQISKEEKENNQGLSDVPELECVFTL